MLIPCISINNSVSLFGLIQMKAPYFPFAMIGIELVRGGPTAAMRAFTGVASAHLYYFLTTVRPCIRPLSPLSSLCSVIGLLTVSSTSRSTQHRTTTLLFRPSLLQLSSCTTSATATTPRPHLSHQVAMHPRRPTAQAREQPSVLPATLWDREATRARSAAVLQLEQERQRRQLRAEAGLRIDGAVGIGWARIER